MTTPQSAPWDAFKDPDLTELEKQLIADLATAKLEWEKLSNERDELRAKLATAEIERDEAKGQSAELKDCLDGAFKSVKAYRPGPHMPGSPLARWEKALSSTSTDCGQSLLARLEEARWLIKTWETLPNTPVNEWLQRRDSWLSGHTPTITPGQYASMSREQLESALSQREDQLRRALAELEECKKGVKE